MTIQKIKTGVIEDNSITTSKFLNQSVTIEKLATSGTLPALDGSALTGIVAGATITKDPNDPAVDTNPADGVGALWLNTSQAYLWVCTDATTDNNIWKSASCGSTNIPVTTGEAYIIAGDRAQLRTTSISLFQFSSSVESQVGDIDFGLILHGANSSTTEGFIHGGHDPFRTTIEKFSFASANVSTPDHGNLSRNLFDTGGTNSSTHGYVHGGRGLNLNGAATTNEKFTFANSGVSTTQVFSLNAQTFYIEGHSNPNNDKGYIFSGSLGSGVNSDIYAEFSFANDNTKTDIGTLITARGSFAIAGNLTDAFLFGGSEQIAANTSNVVIGIERISLSSNNTTASHGDLQKEHIGPGGASTTTHGLCFGGDDADTGSGFATKQLFSFSSDVGSTIIAPLAQAHSGFGNTCQSPAF